MAVAVKRVMGQLSQHTSRDTNNGKDLNAGDSCPKVTQIKITADGEATAADNRSAHVWFAAGNCLSAACFLGTKADALEETGESVETNSFS